MDLPEDRLLNLVYFLATDGAEPVEVAKWEAKLWLPPKGEVVTQGPWSAEAETQAFKSFVSQVKG